MTFSINKLEVKGKNADYSSREGAGVEFIEIINRVDQTASKGSLQLKLDTLGISDSAFAKRPFKNLLQLQMSY